MKITKFIGQTEVVAELNDIIQARENDLKENGGNPTRPLRPLLFKGLTGTGKTELSDVLAQAMEGMNFAELPVASGWNEFGKLRNQTASFDRDKGVFSAIPSVILIDEAHTQRTLADVIKVLYNDKGGPKTISRNGSSFFYDPLWHQVIFASNRTLDAAIEGRCYKLHLRPANKGEKIRLIKHFAEKAGVHFSDEAVELLEGRVKPTPREIKDIVYPFSLFPGKYDAKVTLQKCLDKKFFPMGLRQIDLAILKKIGELRAAPVNVLRTIAQDDKKKDTQDKVDWIVALGLLKECREGYALTKEGAEYLHKIIEAQKAAKAAKAKVK